MWHHVFRPFLQTETKLQSRTADWNEPMSDHGAYDVLWPKIWYFFIFILYMVREDRLRWALLITPRGAESAPVGVMGRCNTSAVDRCHTAQSEFIHPHIVHEWNSGFIFLQSFPPCLVFRFHGVHGRERSKPACTQKKKSNLVNSRFKSFFFFFVIYSNICKISKHKESAIVSKWV